MYLFMVRNKVSFRYFMSSAALQVVQLIALRIVLFTGTKNISAYTKNLMLSTTTFCTYCIRVFSHDFVFQAFVCSYPARTMQFSVIYLTILGLSQGLEISPLRYFRIYK